MRELKFRAWDKKEEEMLHFSNPEFNDEYNLFALKSEEKNCGYCCLDNNFDNCEIMQYTGLKDKNGKEIYEGDILNVLWFEKGITRLEEVKYNILTGGYSPFATYTDIPRLVDIEVVGNIYENPDLLK